MEIQPAKDDVAVRESHITGHRIGIRNRAGGWLTVTRSYVQDNAEWGLLNEDPDQCLLAGYVFWGARTGPEDTSDAEDGCMNGTNISPTGDRVSDDVDWWPYAINADFDRTTGRHPNPWKAFSPFCSR